MHDDLAQSSGFRARKAAGSKVPISIVERWASLALPLFFFLSGIPFLPLPGLQNDETLFAAPLYSHASATYYRHVFHHDIPAMVLTYLGALKTWLYAPLLRIWAPSYLSIRLPVLILGCVAVWMTWLFLRENFGSMAAWTGGLLLATDTMMLLTTCFDWGPVALQHLLLISGLFLFARYARRGARLIPLGCGFFCFGLALWDKALFMWIFSGLAMAAILVYGHFILSRTTARSLAVAALGFALGSLPLILYNGSHHLETYRGNTKLTTKDFPQKYQEVKDVWDGRALFGYLVNEASAGHPRAPQGQVERASTWLAGMVGQCRRNLLVWPAFLLCIALIPVLWRGGPGRFLLFLLTAMLIAWVEMILVKDAGGSVHHVVLLWPLPHIFIGVAFAGAARFLKRPVVWVAALTACLCAGNMLVTNQYLYQASVYGGAGSWTDAIFPLAEHIRETPAKQVLVLDWGIYNTLLVMSQGRLPVHMVGDPFTAGPPAGDQATWALGLVSAPDTIWVEHTRDYEVFPGVNKSLKDFAASRGYREKMLHMFSDRNGRPVFEVFALVK